MKTIPLTQDKVAIVDDIDFDRLNQWKWRAQRAKRKCGDVWYAVRTTPRPKRRTIRMHREIAAIAGLSDVDHRDHDGLNNQRYNLRPCTRSQNGVNSRKQISRSSRFKGVSWHKATSKWQVYIRTKGQLIHLGLFANENEAALVYDITAMDRGEYAKLNFVIESEL